MTTRIGGTPWGPPQTIEGYVPGVFFVSTASHGGFYVSPEAMARAPAWLKSVKTFVQRSGSGAPGWFEEDCDAALVVLAFAGEEQPKGWPTPNVESCQATIRWSYPELAAELGFGTEEVTA